MIDAETKYNVIEKLCMCLYFLCMKLQHYIKLIDVYVSSHCNVIKHMLSKPVLHSRIGKWALALTEFSLTYRPLRAMKGQIVADFIVDHATVEPSLNMVDTNPWRLYFNGSSHKNGKGVGILILSPQDIPTKFKCKVDRKCSNNEVEYKALINGFKILRDLGAKKVKIKGVSEIVIRQITREYKCIKENLLMYFTMAMQLLECFEVVSITHVPQRRIKKPTS